MAESLSEMSSNMEALEEEAKKKSKFKAFKSLFGKKKKKEPEDVQEEKEIKPRFSSSSLKPVLEINAPRPKSRMGVKSMSHDNVFCLELEPEKLASKLLFYPESQRSRPRTRFPISRTLPRATGSDVLGALDRSMDRRSSRSELWISGSKVAEIPPLRSRRFSISSGTSHAKGDFKDLEIHSDSDKTSKSSPTSPHDSATENKAKANQEEQHASLATKEKATTTTKHADQKEHNRDSTGPSSQEQIYKTDFQDKKKTRDQSLSTDAASSTGHSVSGSHPRRRRKRVKTELGFPEKDLLKSRKAHDRDGKAGSSPTEELPGREHTFLKLYLEKQNTEQNPTAEAAVTPPQKMPSDKGTEKGEMAAIDVEAQRTSAPQPIPIDVAESMVSGPLPSHEEESSEGKKKTERAGLLSWIIRPSTSQEEATVWRTVEAQVHMHPSQVCGEEEEAPSLGLQKFQPEKELSLESTTYHKGRYPKSDLGAFSASVSSTTAEDDASMPMSPLPLRRWPNTGEISSYSDSSSEYESSSELQLDPVHSFPLPWNPQGDDVFLKAGNVDPELSKTGCQQPLGCSSQSLGKPKAREVSSEADSSSDDERSSESFQSLDEFEEFLESVSFINDSVSEEKVASRRYSQALLESEENELSTESSSYFEKYYSSDDMSSSEEEQPPEPSKQALGQDRDQQEVLPVSKSMPKESSGSAKPVYSVHTSSPLVSPSTQQQPPILGNVSVAQSRPVESLPPGHTVSSWVSSQSEHQVLAEGNAADWNICMQPPSNLKALTYPVGHTVEQNVLPSPEVSTMGEAASAEASLLRHHSQPPIKPVLEQDISAGPELGVSEECVPPQSPIFPSQPSGGPNIKKEVSLGAESVALEGSHFMELLPLQQPSQPRLKPFTQHQASAFERGLSMDSKLPAQSFQPWMKPQGKQSFSGSEITAFEGNSSMEHVPPSLSQPMKQPYQNVPLESEAVAAKIITMGPLHTKYSTHSLLTPPSQPVSESTSVEGASLVELLPPQPSVMSKFQSQNTRDPVSASTQWGSPMESTPAQHFFQTQPLPKFKQVPPGSDGPEAQGVMSIQPVSSRCPSQPWLTPTFEQISVLPGNVPAAWAIPIHPQSPRMPFQPLMGSVVQQSASTGSMNPSIQQITVEPLPPRNPLQPWPTSPFEQISTLPDKAAKAVWNIPVDPLPRMLSWPLMGSVVQQPVSTELVSVSVPQSSSAELMPYRVPFQSRVDVETYSADEGVSATMRPGRHHSQPPISTEFKEEVSSDSLGASGEWGIPIEPMPSKYAPHPWLGPEFECQTLSLEGIAKEGDICKEAWPPRNPSQSIIEHQAQKTPSRFESPSFEGGIPWKPLPSKVPTPFLMSSKIKDMSSSLENADNQDSSKKQQGKSAPAESFVKFMADQIFAGSTAGETAIYGKPVLRSRSRPSRSLLKPKLEESDLFYNWDDKPKEDTTSKKLSQKQPPQSPGRPKESQEILSYSKGAPVTWSSSAVDSSQPLGKLQYRQKVSVSVSFPEEWKRSEGQLPSTQPSQGFDVARSQPPVLSTASANAPVEWISPEGHPPPSQPPQAVLITDYQQQVYLGSASATTEGTISRKNSGSWAMPKGPDSTKKTMEYTQGCGDFLKGTPTSVTKLGKFTSVPAQKAFASAGASSKKEVLRRSSFLSTSKSKVENVFGVRLRKISQRSGMENPEPMAPVVPAGKDQTNKETPQGSSAGQETSSQAFSSAEKQENRPRYEGTSKKPTVFRPPEKSSSLKEDYITEPSWINVAKQRQKDFASHFYTKPRTRAEIRAETKELEYESKYDPGTETPPKEPEPTTDSPPKMTFSSTVPREAMSSLSKSTKSVAFDDQNKLHQYTREREIRRSSIMPPKTSLLEEPVWFSMAKKKAQAWSQMPDIMK